MNILENSKSILVAIALLIPASANAEEISLTFQDSGLTITGEFAGFVQNAYIVKTDAGELHVPVEMVTCEGNACFEFVDTRQTSG